jgi:hypothetical protein
LARERKSLGLPPAGSKEDESTLVKFVVSGKTIWGINKGTAGLAEEKLAEYNQLAACCNPQGNVAHEQVTWHAEADAIFQAFDKKIMASSGVMYCDHKLCGFCGKSLRNLLCLIGLKTLTWIGPSKTDPKQYVTITFEPPT